MEKESGMARPTQDQMDTAAEWLRINEGDEGEAEACEAVADWLEQQAEAQMMREMAREQGVRVSDLRARLSHFHQNGK